MEPIDRFAGGPSARTLLEALRNQSIVHGEAALAVDLAKFVALEQHASGATLIKQDDADNDIFFILIGEVSIIINGQEINRRHAGQHVGEMALLDPGARRSASVVAREIVVTARVSEVQFTGLADKYPSLWRRIASELGDRLRQRTQSIRARNEIPILFIGSSIESLPVVKELAEGLRSAAFITRPWHRGIFAPSQFPIDDLAKQVVQTDFAALVLGPDDQVLSRAVTSDAPRDNVLLELGLFIGALGRSRTFLIVPSDVSIKIPTDLLGLTPIRFSLKSGTLADSLALVCEELSHLVAAMGAR